MSFLYILQFLPLIPFQHHEKQFNSMNGYYFLTTYFSLTFSMAKGHASGSFGLVLTHPQQQLVADWLGLIHGFIRSKLLMAISHAWINSYEWMNEVNERVRVNELLIRLLLIRLLRRLIRRRLIRYRARKGFNHELSSKTWPKAMWRSEMSEIPINQDPNISQRLICRVNWGIRTNKLVQYHPKGESMQQICMNCKGLTNQWVRTMNERHVNKILLLTRKN